VERYFKSGIIDLIETSIKSVSKDKKEIKESIEVLDYRINKKQKHN